eukprot:364269-Chlamydomonas_euryale.AAC.1
MIPRLYHTSTCRTSHCRSLSKQLPVKYTDHCGQRQTTKVAHKCTDHCGQRQTTEITLDSSPPNSLPNLIHDQYQSKPKPASKRHAQNRPRPHSDQYSNDTNLAWHVKKSKKKESCQFLPYLLAVEGAAEHEDRSHYYCSQHSSQPPAATGSLMINKRLRASRTQPSAP